VHEPSDETVLESELMMELQPLNWVPFDNVQYLKVNDNNLGQL
jgi:hypothetical protein